MPGDNTSNNSVNYSFQQMIGLYANMQSTVGVKMNAIAAATSNVTPGAFLMLQFQMSQATQIGESISNLMSQVQAIVKNSVGNIRG